MCLDDLVPIGGRASADIVLGQCDGWPLHEVSGGLRSITGGSALGGAIFDIVHILAYLVNVMSNPQLYLGFGHSVWSDSLLYLCLYID